jgi:hypothetical protein
MAGAWDSVLQAAYGRRPFRMACCWYIMNQGCVCGELGKPGVVDNANPLVEHEVMMFLAQKLVE